MVTRMFCCGVIALSLTSCVETEDNLASTEQAAMTFSSTVSSMGPVGYWRLGEARGSTVAIDETGNRNGQYINADPGVVAGAITGDTNMAGYTRGVSESYIKFPDAKVHSLTRVWDVFERTVAAGWGNAAGGEAWVPQVSTSTGYYEVTNVAKIRPHGDSGTFQIGIPTTTLLYGDMQVRASWSVRASGGPLQPVALVAQRVDNNNFVKAELIENANHTLDLKIIKYVNGMGTPLGTATNIGTYANAGDWWYVRFQFEGANYRAKAWKMGTIEPADTNLATSSWECTSGCVNGSAASASTGGVAIRSANSASTVRPDVSFNGFWVQTIGMSISMFVALFGSQTPNMNDNGGAIYMFGKGSDGNSEYTVRYHPPLQSCHVDQDCTNTHVGSAPYGHCVTYNGQNCPNNLTQCTCSTGDFKWYLSHWQGGLSAGHNIRVCNTNVLNNPDCAPPVMQLDRWEHVVVEFDPGDALDTQAGVRLYLNGEYVGIPFNETSFATAAMYNNSECCVDAVGGPLGEDTPGVPGTCSYQNNRCESKQIPNVCGTDRCINDAGCPSGQVCGSNGFCTRTCWNIYPMSGSADLMAGRSYRDDEWFNGGFDELAIFPRKLTTTEVQTLYNQSK